MKFNDFLIILGQTTSWSFETFILVSAMITWSLELVHRAIEGSELSLQHLLCKILIVLSHQEGEKKSTKEVNWKENWFFRHIYYQWDFK